MLVDTAQLWTVYFRCYAWDGEPEHGACVVQANTATEAEAICAARAKCKQETIWCLVAAPLEILVKDT